VTDVVTVGEIMVQFNAVTRGPLRSVQLFEKHAAGAEGNVAIGVSRLGCSSGVISRVGDDEFGHYLLGVLMAERVDVSHVAIDPGFPTASFFIQRGHPIPNKSEAFYYRKDSAGSRPSEADVDSGYIASSKILHITGVTPALGESAKAATPKAAKVAKDEHVTFSFDTNVRLKLWSEDSARKGLLPLCKTADIVFTSCPDSKIILNEDRPQGIADALHQAGVKTVVVKLGEKGAFVSSAGEVFTEPAIPTYVEDPTGAGDSFAATFLATQLKGWKLRESLRAANATAALVVSVRGDYENTPTMESLQTLLGCEKGRTEYLR